MLHIMLHNVMQCYLIIGSIKHVCDLNNAVTGVEEITPKQSSLSLTTSLKLFITQMHDCGFGLIGPRQVHAEYKMHTCRTSTTWRVTSSIPTQYRRYVGDWLTGVSCQRLPSSLPPNCTCSVCIAWVRLMSHAMLY